MFRILVAALLVVSAAESSFAQGGLSFGRVGRKPKPRATFTDGFGFLSLPAERPDIRLLQPMNGEYKLEYPAAAAETTRLEYQGGRAVAIVAKSDLDDAFRATLKIEIDDAYRMIEPLGRTETPVTIFIVGAIKPQFEILEKEIPINGLTFTSGRSMCIAMRKDALRFDYLAHELTHQRLTEMGVNFSWWLDEGVAECFESWDYACADHLETLAKEKPVTLEQLKGYKPLQGDEARIRATAWAIAYYLMVMEKTNFNDMEVAAQKLDPADVVSKVLEAKKK